MKTYIPNELLGVIIEFEPNSILLSYPPQWWLYYKTQHEPHFHKISVSGEQLKLFIETYGYESNNIVELKKFGIDTKHIKPNKNVK